jgi:hypothetical protein
MMYLLVAEGSSGTALVAFNSKPQIKNHRQQQQQPTNNNNKNNNQQLTPALYSNSTAREEATATTMDECGFS